MSDPIFTREMVLDFISKRGARYKFGLKRGEDQNAPLRIAQRLANGLDEAPKDGCWEWRRTTSAGYACLTVGGFPMRAHRFAFELGVGPVPDNLQVLHHCDNPLCINPAHLFLGTRSDNMIDATRKGRLVPPVVPQPGESNGAAKLTAAQVSDIRVRLARGDTQRAIGEDFGVSASTIGCINRRETWQ